MASIMVAPGVAGPAHTGSFSAGSAVTVAPARAAASAKYTAGGSVMLAVGDVVAAHTSGSTTHPANVIANGSAKVTIGTIPVAIGVYDPSSANPVGSLASCGAIITAVAAAKYTVSA